MSGFEQRAAAAMADPVRRANIARFAERADENRMRGFAGVDAEALRTEGERIRTQAVADMPRLLDELERKLRAHGATVFRAASGDEAAAYITEVVTRHGSMVVKGKSMASEEIGLNERLEAAGVEVVETDLGEYIVQVAGEHPEHIIIPAIHKTRQQVREQFEPIAGRPIGDEPADLTAFARAHLREKFFQAPVGITGVNFGVAETGSLVLVTNEGNGRMCSGIPRVHIAVMG
ncbi:MAG: LUD domain-containing protein, partial [Gaiellales bacterium]